MKKILSLCLLVLFISVPSFSYDLKFNERIKQEIIMDERDNNESFEEIMERAIKKVDTFIAKIGDQNVLDIKVNFPDLAFGVVYIIIYKVKV